MSSTDVHSGSDAAADVVGAPGMDMKLEVVVLPVADVDRAKRLLPEARAGGWMPTSSPATTSASCS